MVRVVAGRCTPPLAAICSHDLCIAASILKLAEKGVVLILVLDSFLVLSCFFGAESYLGSVILVSGVRILRRSVQAPLVGVFDPRLEVISRRCLTLRAVRLGGNIFYNPLFIWLRNFILQHGPHWFFTSWHRRH